MHHSFKTKSFCFSNQRLRKCVQTVRYNGTMTWFTLHWCTLVALSSNCTHYRPVLFTYSQFWKKGYPFFALISGQPTCYFYGFNIINFTEDQNKPEGRNNCIVAKTAPRVLARFQWYADVSRWQSILELLLTQWKSHKFKSSVKVD